MPACPRSSPKAVRSSSSSRTSCRRSRRQTTSIACRRAASRSPARPRRSRARRSRPPTSERDNCERVTAMHWVNIIIQGVLIGGLYAMFAAGLALIFGVLRLVHIAHGDLIVLAAYLALMVTDTMGLDPLLVIVIVVPIMAVIGYALQRGLLNRTLGDDLLPPLLVTFGLSIIIQNGLLELFTADSRRLRAGTIEVATFPLFEGVWIGV